MMDEKFCVNCRHYWQPMRARFFRPPVEKGDPICMRPTPLEVLGRDRVSGEEMVTQRKPQECWYERMDWAGCGRGAKFYEAKP